MRTRSVFLARRLLALVVFVAVIVAVVAVVHRLGRRSPAPVKPRVAPTVNVTIIPGHSRQQAQKLLHESGIRGNYVKATVRSPLLDPTQYGAPANTPSLEGFLWPDTYNLHRPVKIKALVADQLTAFKQHFAQVNLSYAKSKNLTAYDVLKIASLLTEESMKPGDAPKVASVIYNRLRLGMDLGLDSTVAYATGNYGNLTERDLHSRSPWNTTNHQGLPPTPIDSPTLQRSRPPRTRPTPTTCTSSTRSAATARCASPPATHSSWCWSDDWNAAVAKAAKHRRQRRVLQERQAVMHRLGVLGWPVAHSLSPAIQNAALAAVGLADQLALPAAAGAAGASSMRPCGRCRRSASAASTSRSRTSRRHLRWRPMPARRASRDRSRRTRCSSRLTARSSPTTPTRPR